MNVALPPRELRYVSLCAGGGGLDLGVGLAIPCARPVLYVEREAFAVAHLVGAMRAAALAEAPVWSDARTLDGRRWRGCVDGLVGGIPCQPHSVAGRKLGRLDERDLWSATRRIIVQSRPWFVLIENVAGMLSAGDDEIAGAERLWRDLRKLGFSVEGGLFTAAEVGAPHERRRLFVLGVADASNPRSPCTGRDAQHGGAKFKPSDGCGEEVADCDGERLERQRADAGAVGRQDARRPAGLRGGAVVEHAAGLGWREGRPEPELRSGRNATPGDGGAMADANLAQLRRQPPAGQQPILQRDDAPGLFPPGPGDLAGWRAVLERAPELEPAVRKLADGLAAGMDNTRIDELRLLGNGVVPLQAAHAIRTLAARLAARGSAAAAELLSMMDDADMEAAA